jgi:hypothetical protein
LPQKKELPRFHLKKKKQMNELVQHAERPSMAMTLMTIRALQESSSSSGESEEQQQNHTPLRAMTLDDLQEEEEEREGEEEEEPDDDYYEPALLPSDKRRKKRFRKLRDSERTNCFLCCYKDAKETQVPQDDVERMIQMIREYTGKMNREDLSEIVSEFYEKKIRARVNADLRRGEKPLPPMPPLLVSEHIELHHQDPEVKMVVMLETLQEARAELKKMLFQKHKRRRLKRGDKIQFDNLKTVIKLELEVQSKDPAKMWGYSAGARIDSNAHKQGPVATHTKNMFNYFRQQKRGR